MQDFFFVGLISVVALGVLLYKSILFVIHVKGLKKANEIIETNLNLTRLANHQTQQVQKTLSSIESVADWRCYDPGLDVVEDSFRQQQQHYYAPSKTRRTPTSDWSSQRERVPLATTDFGEVSDEDDQFDAVPVYTYNPRTGGTQVVLSEEHPQTSKIESPESYHTDAETDLLDKEYGVRYASTCEACKYLAIELEDKFHELGQTSQVIETGYQIDGPKKRVKYTRSELYFIESLEGVCEKLLKYNIHKERKDSGRFSKEMSQTFKTLHGLVDKGVKVDLGIPMELWDSPSAEITALKQQCEDYLERYHDIIEQWYWGNREQKLQEYLCRERVLDKDQRSCLDEVEANSSKENSRSEL